MSGICTREHHCTIRAFEASFGNSGISGRATCLTVASVTTGKESRTDTTGKESDTGTDTTREDSTWIGSETGPVDESLRGWESLLTVPVGESDGVRG